MNKHEQYSILKVVYPYLINEWKFSNFVV